MSVRAKFRVTQKTLTAPWPNSADKRPTHVIRLAPVSSGSEENKEFYSYTPGGSIELSVLNDEVGQKFELGKEYYVDFTPAE